MDADEARILLGFPPNSRPNPSQVFSFSHSQVLLNLDDEQVLCLLLFPLTESKFKLISEAYTCLQSGFNASRAYKRQKDEYPSHNPFLP
ncbi:hypothetical protein D0Y65_052238 [Glycine soja]|uniref:Uncharacterized protein n=1 Tax=Glycine soja TaxID=3848 RepID=A0A445FK16_GLYSO|nr:hypothetical protein D0Y65_052238 [Glycine soja]